MSPEEPPKRSRPGFRWEFRRGCRCRSCPWKGNCLGETWPHWVEVKEITLPINKDKDLDTKMASEEISSEKIKVTIAASQVVYYRRAVEMTRADYETYNRLCEEDASRQTFNDFAELYLDLADPSDSDYLDDVEVIPD